MKKILRIISFIFIIGCSGNQFKIESKHENGKAKIIYTKLTDTLINNIRFERKYKIKFSKDGDTLRKGVYLNNFAFKKHFLFTDNKINWIGNYIVPDPYFIDLDKQVESLDFSKYKLKIDSTYLNSAIRFNSEGDSIKSNSHFYTSKFEKKNWEIGDTLKVNFKFYYPKHKVLRSDIYFKVPEDTSLVTVARNSSNEYVLKRLIKSKNYNTVQGVVKILAYDENKNANDTTAYMNRIMFVNEKFNVE